MQPVRQVRPSVPFPLPQGAPGGPRHLGAGPAADFGGYRDP